MKKLVVLVLLLTAGWGCGGDTTGPSPTPTPDQGTPDMSLDATQDMVVVEPDMMVNPDMTVEPDMTADMTTDMNTNIRTLSDYRACELDSDCPVGLGTCVLEIPLNQPDADGRDRVPLSEIFTSLTAGQGVCSSVCTVNTEACASLSVNGNTPDPQPYVCQLVFVGASPYPDPVPALPFDSTLDQAALVAGVPFGAICRPPFQLSPAVDDGFCAACVGGEACPGTGVCWDALTNDAATEGVAGTCLGACSDTCPAGFECAAVAGGNFCKPIADTCTVCQDRDQDGRGAGRCGPADRPVTPVDCDDFDARSYYDPSNPSHPFPDYCAPENDFNCNGISDALEQIASANFGDDHCTDCFDTCGGAVPNGTLRCLNGVCQPSCIGSFANCDGDSATGCETNVADPDFIYYRDADGDGFGDPNEPQFGCDSTTPPAGYVADNTDCDDTRDDVYPGAPELCDGLDNNCDSQVDNNIPWIGDSCQAAAQGACQNGTRQCDGAMGEFCEPGQPATETCNGVDDNCDGVVDRTGAQWAADAVLWYADCDRDGFGTGMGQLSCFAPTAAPTSCPTGQWVTNNSDCDDTNNQVYPGRTEDCATPFDDNCTTNDPPSNWINATDYYRDVDGDGYSPTPNIIVQGCGAPPMTGYSPALHRSVEDCNDMNPLVFPGQIENCNTPFDDNCNGDPHDAPVGTVRRYTDLDGDGYGHDDNGRDFCFASMTAAEQTTYSAMSGGDCNDSPATRTVSSNGHTYTGADQTPNKIEKCDGYDNNCDGVVNDGCPEGFNLQNLRSANDWVGLVGTGTTTHDCPGNKVMSGLRVHSERPAGLCGGAQGVFGVRPICTDPVITENDMNDPFSYETTNESSQTGSLVGQVPVPDSGCGGNTILDVTLNCGSSASMRGLHGESTSFIHMIGPVCVDRRLTYNVNPSTLSLLVENDVPASGWPVGGGNYKTKCANNEVMKGIRARFNNSRLTSIDLRCIDMTIDNR